MPKIILSDVQRAGDPRPEGAMAVVRDGKATVIKRSHYIRTVLEGHLKSAAERGETSVDFCTRVDGAVSEAEDAQATVDLIAELKAEKFGVDETRAGLPELVIRVSWD